MREVNEQTAFTGTQRGITRPQAMSLRTAMEKLSGWWHHGDCIGADKQSHDIAEELNMFTAIHPPSNPAKRAWCRGTFVFEPREYITRNHCMVDMTQSLIATPATHFEELRSGTWATIRYAMTLRRPVTVILPNGEIWAGQDFFAR